MAPEDAGWAYTGLRVLELPAGGAQSFDTGPDEVLVLPLSGAGAVRLRRRARPSWPAGRTCSSGPTDFAYLPPGSAADGVQRGRRPVRAAGGAGRGGGCRSGTVPAAEVPVELRGAGSCSRQVNNFGTPEALRRPTG